LPKAIVEGTTKFYADGVKAGLFNPGTNGQAIAKADLEFYVEGGQLKGPVGALKIEDFWHLAPYTQALK
jgi:NitT/TauT family transport system substrate-binding protein